MSVSTSDLVTIRTVAAMLGECSIRHVRRLADSGRMPAPVKLGALIRFRRVEIEQWIANGCRPIRSAGKAVKL